MMYAALIKLALQDAIESLSRNEEPNLAELHWCLASLREHQHSGDRSVGQNPEVERACMALRETITQSLRGEFAKAQRHAQEAWRALDAMLKSEGEGERSSGTGG